MTMDRRTFVRNTALGTLGASITAQRVPGAIAGVRRETAWTDGMPINPDIDNMKVVCCHDEKMFTGTPTSVFSTVNKGVDQNAVSANMDLMAIQLTGKTTADAAWKTIFHSGKPWPDTRIVIKINSVEPTHLPRVAVIKKICDVLVDVMGAQPANIVVFDGHGNAGGNNKYANYASLTDPAKIRANISNRFEGVNHTQNISIACTRADGTSRTIQAVGPKDFIDGTTDIIVNIAVNKGHDSEFGVGKVTLCLKNHFGSFLDKENGMAMILHSSEALNGINKTDAIVGGNPVRQQLCIIDSLLASRKGPGASPDAAGNGGIPNRLIMGTFAGAVDYCCVKKVREEVNKWTNAAMNEVALFLTGFGYKETDPVWVEITPTGITTERVTPVAGSTKVVFTLSQPSRRNVTVQFEIPSGGTHQLQTKIFDMRGNLVRELRTPPGVNAVVWDGTRPDRRPVANGSYVIRLQTGSFSTAERITVIR
ncbi:MAG: DUF362 domain-containing protein [Chitinispirillaceae bacterium]|nr:DUF362 domain-containing protein [Chitinispirillaceae bacterium]